MNKDKRIVYDLDTSVGMYSNFELDQLAAIAEYEINEIKHIKDRKLNN